MHAMTKKIGGKKPGRRAPGQKLPGPVVGIGASAGGLEALSALLTNMPEDTGLAFVIVQHQDPNHRGTLAELLQRTTSMPVCIGRHRMKIEPNHVYVNPSDRDISIKGDHFLMHKPQGVRGLHLPINFFFHSLATARKSQSIGVILSGMGFDGTLGMQSIKDAAGLTFAQNPDSAKFSSMPESAIRAGAADVVDDLETLAKKIAAYAARPPLPITPDACASTENRTPLQQLIVMLHARFKTDFSQYKENTLQRRIERRISIHQLVHIDDYVDYASKHPEEIEILYKELLIGVTSFFRDPEEWDILREKGLPKLLKNHPGGATLRAWCAGCSTGEEAYSMAILFQDYLSRLDPQVSRKYSLQIFATDLSPDAIDAARGGIFSTTSVAELSPEQLSRHFHYVNGSYHVNKEIRDMVIFAEQNIFLDPPFTRLDLLLCRNLLIYLKTELQRKLLPLFHYNLNSGGLLFLGKAETTGILTSHFAPLIKGRSRIYRRLECLNKPAVDFPTTSRNRPEGSAMTNQDTKKASSYKNLADQILLQSHSPAAVLVNEQGDILYVHGRTGKYLEPAAGKANWNIFAMARDGLRAELHTAFLKAVRKKQGVTLENVHINSESGPRSLKVTIRILEETNTALGLMIIFQDLPLPVTATPAKTSESRSKTGQQSLRFEQEIQELRHELMVSREEMQSSQEELKAANEELQSSNEELQSSNEELTTSKEEMQSLNEELHSLNAELETRVNEFSLINDDLSNLLNSTEIASIFLDRSLNIRRFTPGLNHIFNLIPGDVGRPLTDIKNNFGYDDLADDAGDVLRTLKSLEKDISAGDGLWYKMRILPYRTLSDQIGGVVITFTDICLAKKLEFELRHTAQSYRYLLDHMQKGFATFCPVYQGKTADSELVDFKFVEANEALGALFGLKSSQLIDKPIRQLFPKHAGPWVEGCLKAMNTNGPFTFELQFPAKDGADNIQVSASALGDGRLAGIFSRD